MLGGSILFIGNSLGFTNELVAGEPLVTDLGVINQPLAGGDDTPARAQRFGARVT